MNFLNVFWDSFRGTVRDIIPILVVLGFFQFAVLRRPVPNPSRMLWGIGFVILGLAFFLTGLELALFPLGESMAKQLLQVKSLSADVSAASSSEASEQVGRWYDYFWVYIFAVAIGISTTIAEPSLIAVAMKAEEVSGGTIRAFGLRIAVAIGVGAGVTLGTLRIVLGVPLPFFILPGYMLVLLQTALAPKQIIPLAYDSGGVTTSTVTVPLITALGVGLASRVPGRDPVIDGFGLIAFASLFPMMTVMGYAQLAEYKARRNLRRSPTEEAFPNLQSEKEDKAEELKVVEANPANVQEVN